MNMPLPDHLIEQQSQLEIGNTIDVKFKGIILPTPHYLQNAVAVYSRPDGVTVMDGIMVIPIKYEHALTSLTCFEGVASYDGVELVPKSFKPSSKAYFKRDFTG